MRVQTYLTKAARGLRCALVVALLVPMAPADARADWYKVGEGDSLFVDFPLQSNLQDLQPLAGNGLSLVAIGNLIYWRYQVTVAPDGFITLPSLGPLQVAGLTLAEVRDLVVSKVRPSVKGALVSVGLAESDSAAYYVWGEVKEPGRFAFQRPTSLMEAIGQAGGATENAKLNNVLLLRADGPSVVLDLRYDELAKAGGPFLALRPSDSIVIPRRPFASSSFTTALFILISIVGTAAAVHSATK